MDTVAVAIVLVSAVAHAAWNLIVKSSGDRLVAVWGVFVSSAIILAPIGLVCCGGDWSVAWRNAAASGALHLVYLIGLSRAYESSDLSSAYPIARGVAPGLAALGAVVFLGESLSPLQWAAVVTIGIGLVAIAATGATARGTAYAVLTGSVIALYSVIDSAGVRLQGEAIAYTSGVFLAIAVMQAPLVVAIRGWANTVSTIRDDAGRLLLAGGLSIFAYGLVLYVVRTNPVGLVVALREVSVVFAALAGWWFLHERVGRSRFAGAVAVTVGAILLVS